VKVGHGVAPIPVPDGSVMGGYADRHGLSCGTADALEAHVVTFTDGSYRFALVVLDFVCVNVDLADAVECGLIDLGIDESWVCATHTHSGPETACTPLPANTPAPWIDVSMAAVRHAAQAAIAREQSGSLGRTTVDISDVASVRSKPGAVRSVPVDVVSFHTENGVLDGVLVVLPVHPTVLPASSTVISADLTGAVRRAISAPWVVVATGAAGDISTRGVRRGSDLAECARLGRVVADQVRTGSPLIDGPILTAPADVTLAPGPVPGQNHSTLDPSSRQAETLRQAGRLRQSFGSTLPLRATVRAARIGGLSLIGLPGEPFLDLRSRAGDAILLGYVGGYVGYLPTREAFAGEPTYETVISVVAPGEPERLVDTGLYLLSGLRGSRL
jgi:hypothetical protein